jgi:aspartate 1-decarboxylase
MIEGEKVAIVNINNGERFETYVIPGPKNSGEITLNGPAARKVQKGDIIIVIAYGIMDFEEAKSFKPAIIFPNEETNQLS